MYHEAKVKLFIDGFGSVDIARHLALATNTRYTYLIMLIHYCLIYGSVAMTAYFRIHQTTIKQMVYTIIPSHSIDYIKDFYIRDIQKPDSQDNNPTHLFERDLAWK